MGAQCMAGQRSLPPSHPLAMAATAVAQAGARSPRIPVIDPPQGEDWTRVSDLVSGGYLARWLDEARVRSTYGHRQAAAVKLTEMLAHALLGFTVQSIFLVGTAPDLTSDNLWLRWDAGQINGVALASSTATVVAGRPSSDHPGTRAVPDDDALDRRVAQQVAATFGPLLSEIRAHTRTAWVTLWGRVADIVHVQMLRAAKDLGYDTRAAWRRAERLTDAISEAVPRLRIRPRPFPVHGVDQAGCDWDGTWLVFGTCCYLYKARPDIRQCNVCPLRSDLDRSFDWPRELPPAPAAVGAALPGLATAQSA